jgi:glycosyltransferase involved in cell wall biosynthesis
MPRPSKVSVLFVHTATLPPLGADTWVQGRIIAGLDKATHDVHVACATGPAGDPTPTFEMIRNIRGIDILPVSLGPEFSQRSVRGKFWAILQTLPAIIHVLDLLWYVWRHRIDVIHTTDRPRDAFVCVLLGRFTRTPCIVHLHVGFNPEWMGRMLQWSIRQADALVAISDFVASTLEAAEPVKGTVCVVRNSIDTELWSPDIDGAVARSEFGFTDDDLVIITVCRLFPAKGPGDLIEALARVRAVRSDVRLVVVGKEMVAGYEAELARLAASLGLTDSVVFAGRRSDVPSLMAASDVFAMPSHLEPFGLVYLEAMAMELPVAALDDGGTPEVVVHGVNGLLSRFGDSETLASNLLTLVDDPELRDRMGKAGRERVLAQFGVERMALDMAAVYRLVTSNHATVRPGGR